MKYLMKAILIFVVAALGTGTVLFINEHNPQRKAQLGDLVNQAMNQYIEQNKEQLAENLKDTQAFRDIVYKNYLGDMIKNSQSADKQDDVAKEETKQNAETNAFMEHWDELIKDEISPKLGADNAKVTVIEFFDFACGHCKALAPLMAQLVKDNPDVRFVFKPLYFMSEHSPYAAKVALAAAKKSKFIEVYEGIMTLPEMNEKTINQILEDEELNVDEIKKMIEEKDIRRGLQSIDALSQTLGVNGVPMLIINGEAYYGRSIAEIQGMINSLK